MTHFLISNLILLRKANNIPYPRVARRLKITPDDYRLIEEGKVELTVTQFLSLANFYNLNIRYFLSEQLNKRLVLRIENNERKLARVKMIENNKVKTEVLKSIRFEVKEEYVRFSKEPNSKFY